LVIRKQKALKNTRTSRISNGFRITLKKRSESQVSTQSGGLLPKLNLNTGTPLDDLAKLVKIEPNGSATLIFSEDFSRVQNPTYSLNEQRNAQFKVRPENTGKRGGKYRRPDQNEFQVRYPGFI